MGIQTLFCVVFALLTIRDGLAEVWKDSGDNLTWVFDIVNPITTQNQTYQLNPETGAFRYHFDISAVHSFKFETQSSDKVTMGCYGWKDDDERWHVINYVADSHGWRPVRNVTDPINVWPTYEEKTTRTFLENLPQCVSFHNDHSPEVANFAIDRAPTEIPKLLEQLNRPSDQIQLVINKRPPSYKPKQASKLPEHSPSRTSQTAPRKLNFESERKADRERKRPVGTFTTKSSSRNGGRVVTPKYQGQTSYTTSEGQPALSGPSSKSEGKASVRGSDARQTTRGPSSRRGESLSPQVPESPLNRNPPQRISDAENPTVLSTPEDITGAYSTISPIVVSKVTPTKPSNFYKETLRQQTYESTKPSFSLHDKETRKSFENTKLTDLQGPATVFIGQTSKSTNGITKSPLLLPNDIRSEPVQKGPPVILLGEQDSHLPSLPGPPINVYKGPISSHGTNGEHSIFGENLAHLKPKTSLSESKTVQGDHFENLSNSPLQKLNSFPDITPLKEPPRKSSFGIIPEPPQNGLTLSQVGFNDNQFNLNLHSGPASTTAYPKLSTPNLQSETYQTGSDSLSEKPTSSSKTSLPVSYSALPTKASITENSLGNQPTLALLSNRPTVLSRASQDDYDQVTSGKYVPKPTSYVPTVAEPENDGNKFPSRFSLQENTPRPSIRKETTTNYLNERSKDRTYEFDKEVPKRVSSTSIPGLREPKKLLKPLSNADGRLSSTSSTSSTTYPEQSLRNTERLPNSGYDGIAVRPTTPLKSDYATRSGSDEEQGFRNKNEKPEFVTTTINKDELHKTSSSTSKFTLNDTPRSGPGEKNAFGKKNITQNIPNADIGKVDKSQKLPSSASPITSGFELDSENVFKNKSTITVPSTRSKKTQRLGYAENNGIEPRRTTPFKSRDAPRPGSGEISRSNIGRSKFTTAAIDTIDRTHKTPSSTSPSATGDLSGSISEEGNDFKRKSSKEDISNAAFGKVDKSQKLPSSASPTTSTYDASTSGFELDSGNVFKSKSTAQVNLTPSRNTQRLEYEENNGIVVRPTPFKSSDTPKSGSGEGQISRTNSGKSEFITAAFDKVEKTRKTPGSNSPSTFSDASRSGSVQATGFGRKSLIQDIPNASIGKINTPQKLSSSASPATLSYDTSRSGFGLDTENVLKGRSGIPDSANKQGLAYAENGGIVTEPTTSIKSGDTPRSGSGEGQISRTNSGKSELITAAFDKVEKTRKTPGSTSPSTFSDASRSGSVQATGFGRKSSIQDIPNASIGKINISQKLSSSASPTTLSYDTSRSGFGLDTENVLKGRSGIPNSSDKQGLAYAENGGIVTEPTTSIRSGDTPRSGSGEGEISRTNSGKSEFITAAFDKVEKTRKTPGSTSPSTFSDASRSGSVLGAGFGRKSSIQGIPNASIGKINISQKLSSSASPTTLSYDTSRSEFGLDTENVLKGRSGIPDSSNKQVLAYAENGGIVTKPTTSIKSGDTPRSGSVEGQISRTNSGKSEFIPTAIDEVEGTRKTATSPSTFSDASRSGSREGNYFGRNNSKEGISSVAIEKVNISQKLSSSPSPTTSTFDASRFKPSLTLKSELVPSSASKTTSTYDVTRSVFGLDDGNLFESKSTIPTSSTLSRNTQRLGYAEKNNVVIKPTTPFKSSDTSRSGPGKAQLSRTNSKISDFITAAVDEVDRTRKTPGSTSPSEFSDDSRSGSVKATDFGRKSSVQDIPNAAIGKVIISEKLPSSASPTTSTYDASRSGFRLDNGNVLESARTIPVPSTTLRNTQRLGHAENYGIETSRTTPFKSSDTPRSQSVSSFASQTTSAYDASRSVFGLDKGNVFESKSTIPASSTPSRNTQRLGYAEKNGIVTRPTTPLKSSDTPRLGPGKGQLSRTNSKISEFITAAVDEVDRTRKIPGSTSPSEFSDDSRSGSVKATDFGRKSSVQDIPNATVGKVIISEKLPSSASPTTSTFDASRSGFRLDNGNVLESARTIPVPSTTLRNTQRLGPAENYGIETRHTTPFKSSDTPRSQSVPRFASQTTSAYDASRSVFGLDNGNVFESKSTIPASSTPSRNTQRLGYAEKNNVVIKPTTPFKSSDTSRSGPGKGQLSRTNSKISEFITAAVDEVDRTRKTPGSTSPSEFSDDFRSGSVKATDFGRKSSVQDIPNATIGKVIISEKLPSSASPTTSTFDASRSGFKLDNGNVLESARTTPVPSTTLRNTQRLGPAENYGIETRHTTPFKSSDTPRSQSVPSFASQTTSAYDASRSVFGLDNGNVFESKSTIPTSSTLSRNTQRLGYAENNGIVIRPTTPFKSSDTPRSGPGKGQLSITDSGISEFITAGVDEVDRTRQTPGSTSPSTVSEASRSGSGRVTGFGRKSSIQGIQNAPIGEVNISQKVPSSASATTSYDASRSRNTQKSTYAENDSFLTRPTTQLKSGDASKFGSVDGPISKGKSELPEYTSAEIDKVDKTQKTPSSTSPFTLSEVTRSRSDEGNGFGRKSSIQDFSTNPLRQLDISQKSSISPITSSYDRSRSDKGKAIKSKSTIRASSIPDTENVNLSSKLPSSISSSTSSYSSRTRSGLDSEKTFKTTSTLPVFPTPSIEGVDVLHKSSFGAVETSTSRNDFKTQPTKPSSSDKSIEYELSASSSLKPAGIKVTPASFEKVSDISSKLNEYVKKQENQPTSFTSNVNTAEDSGSLSHFEAQTNRPYEHSSILPVPIASTPTAPSRLQSQVTNSGGSPVSISAASKPTDSTRRQSLPVSSSVESLGSKTKVAPTEPSRFSSPVKFTNSDGSPASQGITSAPTTPTRRQSLKVTLPVSEAISLQGIFKEPPTQNPAGITLPTKQSGQFSKPTSPSSVTPSSYSEYDVKASPKFEIHPGSTPVITTHIPKQTSALLQSTSKQQELLPHPRVPGQYCECSCPRF